MSRKEFAHVWLNSRSHFVLTLDIIDILQSIIRIAKTIVLFDNLTRYNHYLSNPI